MSVDYDLVIIGGASIGRYAALRASQFGARVALVGAADLTPASLLLQTLTQTNAALRYQSQLVQWGYSDSQPNIEQSAAATGVSLNGSHLNWSRTVQWATALSETLAVSSVTDSLVKLALAGVEVIQAEATFERRSVNRHPKLGFTVAERWLRSRAYLLTPAVRATIPAIDGLTAVDFVTLDSLWHSWQTLPQQIVILGVDPRGLALAQVLNRLGVQITIVTSGELMPQHDPELAFLLQAQLESEGITVLTQTPIAQVRQTEQCIRVQTNQQTIEAEALLLATKPQLELAGLDLETAGVVWDPERIQVNRKLQTANPRIYACGEFGTQSAAMNRYEADVAVSNALFLPLKQVNYRSVPIAVATDPPLVSVGLSEPQAKSLYGDDVLVARQSYKTLLKAQVSGDTTGSLKLLCHRNGQIIGAHCFGADADEWISLVALAMQQRLNLKALAQLPTLSPTMSDLLRQAVDQLHQQQRSQRQRDLLETWFNFRRAR